MGRLTEASTMASVEEPRVPPTSGVAATVAVETTFPSATAFFVRPAHALPLNSFPPRE